MVIHDRPLLEIWIELFERHHIDEVLINTHHHADQVAQCINRLENQYQVDIRLFHEKELLGSGGTLLANRSFVEKEDDFIIAYADNLTDIHLGRMIESHRASPCDECLLTMGLFRAPDPRACGIAFLDETNRIIEFREKPKDPKSNLANGGVYVANPNIFNFFPEGKLLPRKLIDLGHHVLPKLVGRMFGYEIEEYIRDIGTIDSFHAALDEWPKKA
jgi:mannose-1-phosphate guanylyltransferase